MILQNYKKNNKTEQSERGCFVFCEVCSPISSSHQSHHLTIIYLVTWQIAICHYGILPLTNLTTSPSHQSHHLIISSSHRLIISPSHHNLSCYLANCHLPLRDFTSHHLTLSSHPLTPSSSHLLTFSKNYSSTSKIA
ncbi:Uncharacterised protein [Myroides odoratus]|nr:hypothetical protein Myrod_2981 [Myroides odoratus DSM 2801]EKB04205.1 hypothetical protein HMPREF9716_03117 [Myroides odoratus CIP 103059]STZ31077.1 Uncharacterised protein [Myroides odoratus]